MDGIDTSPKHIEAVRDEIIFLRDAALRQNDFTWSVVLSHVIAMLAEFKTLKENLQ